MKKNYLIALMVLLSINMHAQYKKASFLTKAGRTHDIGGAGHFINDGNVTLPGIFYSYGKESTEKRIFHWFDLELTLPAKFSYKTQDAVSQNPVTVSGKSSTGLIYRYNLAYYLMDNSNADNKLLPFITAGINFTIAGTKIKTVVYSPESFTDVKKTPAADGGNAGANLGLGGIYNFTSKVGLKLTAGYSYQVNANANGFNQPDGYSIYNVFASHPYVTLGVRFRMDGDDD